MSTCNESYAEREIGLSERITAFMIEHVQKLSRAVFSVRASIVRIRRLHATETALDSLPEGIREDIGWPDLYERQVQECHELKYRSN
ncbi:hypothetical protein [Phyllobacterium sp. YR531]|uniref:hypothetical protein n=1 Tax=Phyllobacterium sp. YR531 TaxID=1144343 RepID=UPI00026F7E3E|nr:hypothetical protein [Phyllobacterium sp. YR531]EJN03986.1 hypothetical protein PMI41_01621 [Phyllobacterium sp. YR531]